MHMAVVMFYPGSYQCTDKCVKLGLLMMDYQIHQD